MTVDDDLAAWVAGTGAPGLPALAVDRARLLLLDALASAFAGRQTPDVPAMASLAGSWFGPGGAAVIGGGTLAPAGAALLNGFQVTAATVCDVHRPTMTHATPEVVPAALAASHEADPTGTELVTSVAVGLEVAIRVARALDTEAYRARRFHNPGIAGAVGAAAAVARLLRLDATRTRDALAHAASQAGGTFAALGSSGVKVHQARGAVSGLLAGALAGEGIDGAAEPLGNPSGGLLAAYADGGDPAALTDGLGTTWAMESISLRRWPAASSLQPVIAATLAARTAVATGGAVRTATVSLPPRGFALNGAAGWPTQLEALQSARWIVAVVLADGECWVRQTAPERLADRAVAAFASDNVRVVEDPSLPEGAARVRLNREDGRAFEHEVRTSPGDPSAPLIWADVGRKLHRALEGPGGPDHAAAVADAVRTLGDAPARPLLDLLATAVPATAIAGKDSTLP